MGMAVPDWLQKEKSVNQTITGNSYVHYQSPGSYSSNANLSGSLTNPQAQVTVIIRLITQYQDWVLQLQVELGMWDFTKARLSMSRTQSRSMPPQSIRRDIHLLQSHLPLIQ